MCFKEGLKDITIVKNMHQRWCKVKYVNEVLNMLENVSKQIGNYPHSCTWRQTKALFCFQIKVHMILVKGKLICEYLQKTTIEPINFEISEAATCTSLSMDTFTDGHIHYH